MAYSNIRINLLRIILNVLETPITLQELSKLHSIYLFCDVSTPAQLSNILATAMASHILRR